MNPREFRLIRAVLCLSFGILFLNSRTHADGPTPIDWRPDLVHAQAEARTQNRLVWIQFTGPWCHNCVRMEGETFTHSKVIDHSRDSFIPVKLRSDVNEDLALGYGLTGLPATVIIKPTGEVIAKHEGFVDADTFQAFLRSALARDGRSLQLVSAAPTPRDLLSPKSRSEPPLALQGFCPVTLNKAHRLTPGRTDLALVYDERLYRFADTTARDAFQRQPDRFIPSFGGRCPVTQLDRGVTSVGDPRWGVVYQHHLYLCADKEGRNRFLQDPERYARVDLADRGFCPHCWKRHGLLVRGQPQYSLTRDGHRYLFPDINHLEAFRTTLDTSRR